MTNKKIIALIIRINIYLLALSWLMRWLQEKYIYEYNYGFYDEIGTFYFITWCLLILTLPIFLSLLLGKTRKVKNILYAVINSLPCLFVIGKDIFSDVGGEMSLRGMLTMAAILYYIITLLIFTLLISRIKTE